MLKEYFLGRNPSHFQVNSLVKSFIISETFLWSAWNFVIPIFAIFAATEIRGGNVEVAASAYSTYLVVRVIFELLSGSYLSAASDKKKMLVTIAGMVCLSTAYFGFSKTSTLFPLYVFYGIAGVGLGISSPAKNSLFSTHLDKNKEPFEWGMHDAAVFTGMALAAALGGFIAKEYGFQPLFILASIVNLIGLIPFILYIRHMKESQK